MELTADLVPLTSIGVTRGEVGPAMTALQVENIDFALNPPWKTSLGVMLGVAGRSRLQYTIYVRPADLEAARSAVRTIIPGYLLEG